MSFAFPPSRCSVQFFFLLLYSHHHHDSWLFTTILSFRFCASLLVRRLLHCRRHSLCILWNFRFSFHSMCNHFIAAAVCCSACFDEFLAENVIYFIFITINYAMQYSAKRILAKNFVYYYYYYVVVAVVVLLFGSNDHRPSSIHPAARMLFCVVFSFFFFYLRFFCFFNYIYVLGNVVNLCKSKMLCAWIISIVCRWWLRFTSILSRTTCTARNVQNVKSCQT